MRPITNISHEDYLNLIFKVFQTPNGKTLLKVWETQFIYRKTAQDGDGLLEVGLKTGEQNFILSIINLIEQQQEINNKG